MSDITELFSASELKMLQADSPIPLYHQLYQLLKRRILNGSLANGSKLPTEAQLAEGFGVSRITAKRVMDLLASDGLIERKRGKGSHVIFESAKSEVEAPLVGMLAKLASMSRETTVKVLDIEYAIPPANIAEDLSLPADEKVHYVTRTRFSEESAPFAYYETWTRGIVHGYSAQEIESAQRFAIMEKNGVKVTRIEQYLSADAASAVVADALQLMPGDPVLTLVRHSFDHNGDVVDLLHAQYHPGRFHYRMNLSAEDYAS